MRHPLRHIALGGLLVAWLVPAGAAAVEVQPQSETTVTWTDNLFSARTNPESELSVREAPGFTLSDEGSRLKWKLKYAPSYEFFTRNNDLSGFDHEADGSLTYRLAPRTTLTLNDSFKRFRSISRFNQSVEIPGGISTLEVVQDRVRFIRNIGNVSLDHMLDRRNDVYASWDHALLQFSDPRETDRANQGATAGYNYLWDPQTRVGGFLSWRNQVLTNSLSKTRSEADFYNVSLSLARAFDPTLSVSLSGGPTLVKSSAQPAPVALVSGSLYPVKRVSGGYSYIDASTCPTLPDGRPYFDSSCSPYLSTFGSVTGSLLISPAVLRRPRYFNPAVIVPFQGTLANPGSDSSTTFFLDAKLTKEWGHWKLRLIADRRDDTSGGAGATSVSNTGNFRLEWTPRAQWLFIWSGTYVRRESQIKSNLFRFALVPTTAGTAPCVSAGVFGGQLVCIQNVPGAARVDTAGALGSTRKDVIDSYRTFVRAEYRMTRRLTLQGTALYMDEQENLAGVKVRDFNRLSIWFGLKYDFDPFHI